MNIYLAWTLTVLWWICYPVGFVLYYIAIVVQFVATLLYTPLAVLLQPLVFLVRFILICLALPFQFLAKLEPLYNFLGVAALVGILIGLGVSYLYRKFHTLLRLDSAPEPGRKSARTAKEYREAKAKQKAKVESPLHSPGYGSLSDGLGINNRRRNGRGILAQTIMEEGDSDY